MLGMDEYEITWEELEIHENAKGQEWKAMTLYAQKYKEPPPFNLQIRREMFLIVGIGRIGKSRIVYEPDEFVKLVRTWLVEE